MTNSIVQSTASDLSASALPAAAARAQRLTKVRLRVWGFTRDDAAHAEIKARRMRGARFWEITEVIATSGGVSPIPSRDPMAVSQAADYDRAWAVYLAGSDAG
ncbi:hypothetical protein KGA66_10725 [Actinocrinis puniceicyclus]|uniref:Uncharacterized protein n=1 Tax=Actinocrinis puniceicyclus TaxID=977794 RepID=A0A8J7WNS9_9ACTN|nr:hypothetical protein [Actinocrinis puniceicyclus]MBS2963522.1 hypothetical protein [Actinocrinis puniceicyclus]